LDTSEGNRYALVAVAGGYAALYEELLARRAL